MYNKHNKYNYRPSLVLFKSEKHMEDGIKEIYNFVWKKYGIKTVDKMRFIGSRISDTVHVLKFGLPRRMDYNEYDDLLIYIIAELGYDSYENKGILIGHFDENGFLWTDYKDFKNNDLKGGKK